MKGLVKVKMREIYTHTLVKNGQPFIGLVLQQVLPYVEKMLITISEKSTDGTEKIIQNLAEWNPGKIKISYENVVTPGELTKERQKQIDLTPDGKWVLFLDSDDMWTTESLERMQHYLKESEDAFAMAPFQLIDNKFYDHGWMRKYFTKWFRKQPGLHYRNPWPSDLIYLNDEMLYWKKSKKVKILSVHYFHLSNIMPWTFRKEDWAKKKYLKDPIGPVWYIPEIYKNEIDKIFSCL